MVLGLENVKGLGFIENFSFKGLISGVTGFLIVVGVFAFLTIIVAIFLLKRKEKKLYNITIHFFEEVQGNLIPIEQCLACELTIPNTSVKVFYIKSKDLYLPRGVRKMGKNSYWYAIRDNKEIVNFRIKNINKEMKEANLDYDHTDMRYAMNNLRDLIKRNYRDKSIPWWREYKEVISIVIYVFVLTLSIFFILNKIGDLIDKVGLLIDHADQLVQSARATSGSGIAVK